MLHKEKYKKTALIILIGSIILLILYEVFVQGNTVLALSKYGSRGNEVTQIQTKLKRWGYYKGSVDGIYGSKTVSAVKSFQRKNGLTADGIAGKNTLAAMGINSSSNNSGSSSSNSSNLNLLARLVYGEARG